MLQSLVFAETNFDLVRFEQRISLAVDSAVSSLNVVTERESEINLATIQECKLNPSHSTNTAASNTSTANDTSLSSLLGGDKSTKGDSYIVDETITNNLSACKFSF